jgi:alpha-glucosidase
MKKQLSYVLLLVTVFSLQAQNYVVSSPDKNLELKVNTEKKLAYEVFYKGKPIISPSEISMNFSNGTITGKQAIVTKTTPKSVNEILTPVLGKNKTISNNYNELRLDFKGYSLLLRACNEGVAYRL